MSPIIMGSKEKGADTNIFLKPDPVEKPASAQKQLYLSKYLLNSKGYPWVPFECLGGCDAGIFRPIDIVNGNLIVRRA